MVNKDVQEALDWYTSQILRLDEQVKRHGATLERLMAMPHNSWTPNKKEDNS